MKRSAQYIPPYRIGLRPRVSEGNKTNELHLNAKNLRPRVSVGNKTNELHLNAKNYNEEGFISVCQADH
jgi:hypothetical protein